MAFSFNPLTGQMDLIGNSSGGGGSVTQSPNYFTTFNNTTDWGSPSGGYYTKVLLASAHGKGSHPIVQLWEDIGGGQFTSIDVPLTINSSGDITIQVSDIPDLRFSGLIICSENN